jgi:protein required for attachment to host cells
VDTKINKDGEYFLHGQEIDDFHNLDKNAIFTVVTAAVQDIDRIQQAQQASQTQMQAKQQADAMKIEALETQLKELQNKYKLLEDNVALLLSKM